MTATREDFEAWFLAYRKSTWRPAKSDPRKDMPAHWNTFCEMDCLRGWQAATAAERKPLSDAAIDAVTDAQWGYHEPNQRMAHRAYVRAIEAAIRQGGEVASIAQPAFKTIVKLTPEQHESLRCKNDVSIPGIAKPAKGFQCEPQPAVTDDGFCDWVCPKPLGYLMQCCDCGLIHEVESRVAEYQPLPSEEYSVVKNPDLQVQWRMKRRDDLADKGGDE